MDDIELSIQVAAYRLRDLQDIAERDAPALMRIDYSPQEVAAAMYNIGTDNFEKSVTDGTLGLLGRSYALSVRGNGLEAHHLICTSGRWECSG